MVARDRLHKELLQMLAHGRLVCELVRHGPKSQKGGTVRSHQSSESARKRTVVSRDAARFMQSTWPLAISQRAPAETGCPSIIGGMPRM